MTYNPGTGQWILPQPESVWTTGSLPPNAAAQALAPRFGPAPRPMWANGPSSAGLPNSAGQVLRPTTSAAANARMFAPTANAASSAGLPSNAAAQALGSVSPGYQPTFGPPVPPGVGPNVAAAGRFAGLRGLPGTIAAQVRGLPAGNGGMGLGIRGANGALTGVAGRLGIGTGLGLLGSNLVDRVNVGGNQSNWEQGLQGAAVGAGVGGSIGSILPVIGTGIGAGVGGLLGGGIGVIANELGGGGDNDKATNPTDQLNTWLSSVPLSTDMQRNIRQQYQMEMMFAEDADDPEAAKEAALQNAQNSIQLGWATEQQQEEQAARALEFQMAAQRFTQPRIDAMVERQDAHTAYVEGMTDTLPPEYQGIARMTASQGRVATARTAAAYAQQIGTFQQSNALNQYYGGVNNAAAQMMSQQISQGIGGGAGAATLADQIATLPAE